MTTFQDKVKALRAHHEELLSRKNEPVEWGNGPGPLDLRRTARVGLGLIETGPFDLEWTAGIGWPASVFSYG